MWAGLPCYIIGGGPSVLDLDLSLLAGQLTIGINRAYELMDPTIIFGMDARFWTWVEVGQFGPEMREKFDNYRKGFKVWLAVGGIRTYPEDFLLVEDRGMDVFSQNLLEGIGNGNNSGYAALNLAYLLGANPISLIGYDMKGDAQGAQSWFHSGYPQKQAARVYAQFREKLEKTAAPALAAAGRKVFNLCEDSALTCFPRLWGSILELVPRTPLVVSYYTPGSGYEECAHSLENSLRPWGLERDIRPVPDQGGWQKNTQYKAQFLLDMLAAHPGRPLLYLDADATMEEYPRLLLDREDCDLAAHIRQGKELLSGTLYLSGSPDCRRIMQAWVDENKSHPNQWDQLNLQQVVHTIGLRFKELPAEYCCIFDSMQDVDKPVILQWQASRRLKREVGA